MWPPESTSLFRFGYPYTELQPISSIGEVTQADGIGGVALVWRMNETWERRANDAISRPSGVSLIMILPQGASLMQDEQLLSAMPSLRPGFVLPYHGVPAPFDLVHLLRQKPDDLPGQMLDFMSWRGTPLSSSGRYLLHRTFEAARDLTSVSALARSFGISRRALGRRFAEDSLPPPSRCLQAARVLFAHLLSISTESNLSAIAHEMGYSDPFSMSNQVARLVGIRPLEARKRLGWEWMMEAWLRREATRSSDGRSQALKRPRACGAPSPSRPS